MGSITALMARIVGGGPAMFIHGDGAERRKLLSVQSLSRGCSHPVGDLHCGRLDRVQDHVERKMVPGKQDDRQIEAQCCEEE